MRHPTHRTRCPRGFRDRAGGSSRSRPRSSESRQRRCSRSGTLRACSIRVRRRSRKLPPPLARLLRPLRWSLRLRPETSWSRAHHQTQWQGPLLFPRLLCARFPLQRSPSRLYAPLHQPSASRTQYSCGTRSAFPTSAPLQYPQMRLLQLRPRQSFPWIRWAPSSSGRGRPMPTSM